jgi:hypothetical protein
VKQLVEVQQQVHTDPSELDQVSSVRSIAFSIFVRAEDRLEGASNFNVWKLRIMNILQKHDLEQYVTTMMEKPTSDARRAAFRKSQAKAKRIIFDSVKDSIMSAMTSLMTTKECLDTLVNLYEKQTPSQKRTLKHKIKYLKMEKGESVASLYSRIAQIRDHLLVTGVTMDDDDLVQAIFDGLPSSWETLSSVNGREIQPTFERLWHDCLQEESRTATRSKPTKEEHLALTSRFKGKKKVTFHKGSQKNSNTKGMFKGKSIDTSKIKCFSCNKLDHFARDCWYRKKNPRKGKHHASTAEDDESKRNQKSPSNEREDRKEYYMVSALSNTDITGPKTWLVDNGASKHMTRYKEILSDFKTKSFAEQVELGDEKCYKIEGVGSISFRLEYEARLHVDEVLYVPGIRKNLLSVATLENKGYWVIFKNRKALMRAKGSHLSTAEPIGSHRGGIYVVTGQSVHALAHNATSSSELWHRRLGHLYYKALQDLQNMVRGVPSISLSRNEICKGCMLGENIKKAFTSNDNRAHGILDLVHSDVCGPMSSPLPSGCPVNVHVPKEKRTKMEPSSKKGVFVGYSENSKAYRIYVASQRTIEVSKDVTFHEEVTFKKSRELQQESKAV